MEIGKNERFEIIEVFDDVLNETKFSIYDHFEDSFHSIDDKIIEFDMYSDAYDSLIKLY